MARNIKDIKKKMLLVEKLKKLDRELKEFLMEDNTASFGPMEDHELYWVRRHVVCFLDMVN